MTGTPEASTYQWGVGITNCVECHQKDATPVVVQQWATSRHAQNAIGCFECHQADKTRPDAFEHNGQTISLLVTPKNCGVCHDKETEEFEGSHHAKAGEILMDAEVRGALSPETAVRSAGQSSPMTSRPSSGSLYGECR